MFSVVGRAEVSVRLVLTKTTLMFLRTLVLAATESNATSAAPDNSIHQNNTINLRVFVEETFPCYIILREF